MSTTSLFTPVSASIGGLLIGLAAAVLLLANGDVMGASSISSSIVLKPRATWNDDTWKLLFCASFIVTSVAYVQIDPNAIVDVGATQSLSVAGWILSGLLVGFGSKLGNGCTSGHGVCGMARLSKRSMVALSIFMLVAFATTTLVSQDFFQSGLSFLFLGAPSTMPSVNVAGQIVFGTVLVSAGLCSALSKPSLKMIGAVISGAVFAVGLAVGKMTLPSKIIGFLDLSGFADDTYDPSLIIVMGVAVAVSFASYQYKNRRCESPLCAKEFNIPTNQEIDAPLIIGAVAFGAGWGFGGVCPAPALFLASNGVTPVLFAWMPSYLIGSFLAALCDPNRISFRCCRGTDRPSEMPDPESGEDLAHTSRDGAASIVKPVEQPVRSTMELAMPDDSHEIEETG